MPRKFADQPLRRKRPPKLVEQLVSVVMQDSVTVHAYVICGAHAQQKVAANTANRLFAAADDRGYEPLGVVLLTVLESSGGSTVRDLLRSMDGMENALALAQKVLDGKDHYHLTIFAVPTGCEWDEQLMRLH